MSPDGNSDLALLVPPYQCHAPDQRAPLIQFDIRHLRGQFALVYLRRKAPLDLAGHAQVAEGSDEFRINTDTDNQLEFALKLLNG